MKSRHALGCDDSGTSSVAPSRVAALLVAPNGVYANLPWRLAQSFGPEYEPEQPKPSVPKHLRRTAPGHYESPDGRYEVAYDFYWLEGECGCAICQGYIFGTCPNEGCGKREGWHIWDNQENDYAFFAHEPQAFETFREARAALLYAYESGDA